MSRFLLSLLIGAMLGVGIGLFLGWVQFPVEYVNSPATSLALQHKDEYTVMIAQGYMLDGDSLGAVQRLRLIGVDNAPLYVQEITERFITNSRDIQDIYALVGLAEGLGRLTPLMEPYRIVNRAGTSQ